MTVCLLQLAVCPLEAAVCWLEAVVSRLLMGSAVATCKGPVETVSTSTGTEAVVTTGLGMCKVLVVELKVMWFTVSTFSTFSVVLEDCSVLMEDGSGAEVELWLWLLTRVKGLFFLLPVLG